MEHIARHDVTPEEAEEALADPQVLVRRTRHQRYLAYGQTDAGRHLIVILAIKPGGIARVITAREMDETERQYYERRGK